MQLSVVVSQIKDVLGDKINELGSMGNSATTPANAHSTAPDVVKSNPLKDLERLTLREASVKALGKVNAKNHWGIKQKIYLTRKDLLEGANKSICIFLNYLILAGFGITVLFVALSILGSVLSDFLSPEAITSFHLVELLDFFKAGAAWMGIISGILCVLNMTGVIYYAYSFFDFMKFPQEQQNASIFYKKFNVDINNFKEKDSEIYGVLSAMNDFVKESVNEAPYKNVKRKEIDRLSVIEKACVDDASVRAKIMNHVYCEGVTGLGKYKFHVKFFSRKSIYSPNDNGLIICLKDGLAGGFKALEEIHLKRMDELMNEFLVVINSRRGNDSWVERDFQEKVKSILIEFSVIYFRFFCFVESGENPNLKMSGESGDVSVQDLHEQMRERIKNSKDYKMWLLNSLGKS